ncbi:MAG: chromosome partition protein MukE [Escherichia sp.]
MDFQEYLEEFYARYNVELIRAPEGFFYLRPRSTTLIPRSVLSELDMMVGKILCYLYLSPERLANEGIFTQQELYDELLTLADEAKLLKLVNNRSTGQTLTVEVAGKSAFFAQPSASFRHGVVYGPRRQQVPHYRIGVPLPEPMCVLATSP